MQRRSHLVSIILTLSLALGGLVGLGGCATLAVDGAIEAATAGDVQDQAWQNVQELTAELGQLDARKYPGIGALVRDLREAASRVGAGAGGAYDQLDAAKLIAENPHYWQALLEMEPGDTTLAVLEGMVLAAAGKIEGAQDVLELAAAGPLLDEELGHRVAAQQRTIDSWSLTPPGIELIQVAGLPADERWEPVKRLEAMYPESATAAMAVLKMRTDLADIDLTAEGEDERMRDKILAAEPQAMAVLTEQQPLWAAILRANGEAGDAGRRIAKMLEEDEAGTLNLSAADWAQLVADFDRIGLPDWAVRAVRMRAAESGGLSESDLGALRQLLPQVLPEATATKLLAALEEGAQTPAVLHRPMPDPTGTAAWPVDPVVGGTTEQSRRIALAVLDKMEGEPTKVIEKQALVSLAANARLLGDLAGAERALNEAAVVPGLAYDVDRERLNLAMARGDQVAVESARAAVLKHDRKLRGAHFVVGNSYILTGDYQAASEAFLAGFKNPVLPVKHRAYAAVHSYCAATLAGTATDKHLRQALDLVDEDEWVRRLILCLLGEVDRTQLLIEAEEGRSYIALGQRCEAHLVLAFAPGQTAAGRRAELQACRDTGMANYIEYEFATLWLSQN